PSLIRPGRQAGRGHQGQGRLLALADEPPVAVDHEPPAVASPAPRLDHGLAEVDCPPRLQRINMDRREAAGYFRAARRELHVTDQPAARTGERAAPLVRG